MQRRIMVKAGAMAMAAGAGLLARPVWPAEVDKSKFKRVPTQFIAALGAAGANAGSGAQDWGLWAVDPGPRGVKLSRFGQLQKAGGVAPEGWKFDNKDWWLEEHGLIMEQPTFPVPPGKYLVTGDRDVITVLTLHPADKNGDRRWELGDRATLYQVTHLGCRAARYAPAPGAATCSPAAAQQAAFPVEPGGVMPAVPGCTHQDYAVLIVVAVGIQA